ncbi:MAG TPA: DoxX family protein [Candidatus Saccharimonadales bacterium]|nr:DoxX family protein [Candidatus Saccharimonadales bacterium]
MKFLRTFEPLALLVLRLNLALIFLYHGYPKLAHPSEQMRDFFTSHGFPAYFVGLAGIIECFGGLLLAIGLFTRPAALILAGEMAVAIAKVHSLHGLISVKDYEFPLTLAAACFVLATIGAGIVSADHLVFGETRKKHRTAKSSTKD